MNIRIKNRLTRSLYYSLVGSFGIILFNLRPFIVPSRLTIYYFLCVLLYIIFIIVLPKMLFLSKHTQDETMEEMLDFKYNVLGSLFILTLTYLEYIFLWYFFPSFEINLWYMFKQTIVLFFFINAVIWIMRKFLMSFYRSWF